VKFFERSGLPRELLAKVWAFADSTRRGYLDVEAFKKALELVSIAQKTGNVSLEEYNERKAKGSIELPVLEGLPTLGPPPEPKQFSPYYDTVVAPAVMVAPTGDSATKGASPAGYYFANSRAGPAMPLPESGGKKMGPFSTVKGQEAVRSSQSAGEIKRKESKRATLTTKDVTSITDGLRKIYFQKVGGLILLSA
jgi:EH domain-containing protein 1